MSYQTQYDLSMDALFQSRVLACTTEQAGIFKDDARPSWVSTANAILKANGDISNAFVRLNAAGPGISDKADNGDGTIDSSKILDADLLSITQANWPVVSDLYFNEDGTSIEG